MYYSFYEEEELRCYDFHRSWVDFMECQCCAEDMVWLIYEDDIDIFWKEFIAFRETGEYDRELLEGLYGCFSEDLWIEHMEDYEVHKMIEDNRKRVNLAKDTSFFKRNKELEKEIGW